MLRILMTGLLALLPLVGMAEKPQRVITLGSAITETVFELNAGHRLVGADDGSRHPAATDELPKVGKMAALSAAAILALKPDLVIAHQDAGPETVLAQLRETGIRVETIQIGPTADAALAAMERVGEVLGSTAGGKWLARDNRKALQRLHARYGKDNTKPRVLFVLLDAEGEPRIGGGDTIAASMIRLAGGENAAGQVKSYVPAQPGLTHQLAPDVIVAASQSFLLEEELDELLNNTGLAQSPAGRSGRVFDLNSNLLLSMGPRLGAAATLLAEVIREMPELEDADR